MEIILDLFRGQVHSALSHRKKNEGLNNLIMHGSKRMIIKCHLQLNNIDCIFL